MRIYIVRHAETEFNVLGINQGHRDSPISETGKWQTRMIAERLKDEKIDACYSSDLLRAVKTAEVIMGMHPGKKVMLSKEIREGNIGVFSGKPQGSMSRYAQEKNIDFFSFVPEGGESIIQMRARVSSFFENLASKHMNDNILIVSHGGPIANLLIHTLKIDTEENFRRCIPQNTALSIIEFNGGKIDPIIVNSISHLEQKLL